MSQSKPTDSQARKESAKSKTQERGTRKTYKLNINYICDSGVPIHSGTIELIDYKKNYRTVLE